MKMKRCDNCGEEWEESFFCEKHSNVIYTEMAEVPDIMWSGASRTSGNTTEEIEMNTGDLCFNCCNCNIQTN